MFENIEMAPRDAILGLTEAFVADPNCDKINLSVGVYQDASGKTPILDVVREAEQRLLRSEVTKSYLGIAGPPEYARAVQRLILGADHEVVTSQRAATAQTPGGTGALRVAGDFLKARCGAPRVWLSQPTWPNHAAVFAAAGLATSDYPYLRSGSEQLDIDAMLSQLNAASAGDVVVLHACCHNPTGIDPTADEWRRIAAALVDRGLLPLLDFAYQGFAKGLAEDAAALQILCQPKAEMIVCSSFSKNFGLYRERVGALTVIGADQGAAQRAESQVKQSIRANYSNPPAHGGQVVITVLSDPELRARWEAEVATMRDRIQSMREALVDALADQGVTRDFSFMTRQRGMFSFSGLSPEQVDRLREEYSIYIVRSGRINVAGITPQNIGRLAAAIAEVLKST